MIKYLFKSLYNNAVVVEERKKHGWWVSVILLILGLFLIITPTLVNGLGSRGSSIITTTNNYELDRALVLFANDEYDADISNKHLEVKDERLLATYKDNGVSTPIVYTQDDYVSTEEGAIGKTVTLLKVYYYPNDPLISTENEEAYTTWLNGEVLQKNEDGTPMVAPSTFMILTPTYYTINVYNPLNDPEDTAVSTNATYSGLYDQVEKLQVLHNGENQSITNLKQLKGSNDNETYINLCRFLDNSYESTKIGTLWMTLGTNIGLSALFVLIGIICIFVFLRGKNSIYKDISFLDAFKIGCTFVFTPAVIALALGFFVPQFALFGLSFMAPYALRIATLVSKSRMNSNTTNNKPVYQARS